MQRVIPPFESIANDIDQLLEFFSYAYFLNEKDSNVTVYEQCFQQLYALKTNLQNKKENITEEELIALQKKLSDIGTAGLDKIIIPEVPSKDKSYQYAINAQFVLIELSDPSSPSFSTNVRKLTDKMKPTMSNRFNEENREERYAFINRIINFKTAFPTLPENRMTAFIGMTSFMEHPLKSRTREHKEAGEKLFVAKKAGDKSIATGPRQFSNIKKYHDAAAKDPKKEKTLYYILEKNMISDVYCFQDNKLVRIPLDQEQKDQIKIEITIYDKFVGEIQKLENELKTLDPDSEEYENKEDEIEDLNDYIKNSIAKMAKICSITEHQAYHQTKQAVSAEYTLAMKARIISHLEYKKADMLTRVQDSYNTLSDQITKLDLTNNEELNQLIRTNENYKSLVSDQSSQKQIETFNSSFSHSSKRKKKKKLPAAAIPEIDPIENGKSNIQKDHANLLRAFNEDRDQLTTTFDKTYPEYLNQQIQALSPEMLAGLSEEEIENQVSDKIFEQYIATHKEGIKDIETKTNSLKKACETSNGQLKPEVEAIEKQMEEQAQQMAAEQKKDQDFVDENYADFMALPKEYDSAYIAYLRNYKQEFDLICTEMETLSLDWADKDETKETLGALALGFKTAENGLLADQAQFLPEDYTALQSLRDRPKVGLTQNDLVNGTSILMDANQKRIATSALLINTFNNFKNAYNDAKKANEKLLAAANAKTMAEENIVDEIASTTNQETKNIEDKKLGGIPESDRLSLEEKNAILTFLTQVSNKYGTKGEKALMATQNTLIKDLQNSISSNSALSRIDTHQALVSLYYDLRVRSEKNWRRSRFADELRTFLMKPLSKGGKIDLIWHYGKVLYLPRKIDNTYDKEAKVRRHHYLKDPGIRGYCEIFQNNIAKLNQYAIQGKAPSFYRDIRPKLESFRSDEQNYSYSKFNLVDLPEREQAICLRLIIAEMIKQKKLDKVFGDIMLSDQLKAADRNDKDCSALYKYQTFQNQFNSRNFKATEDEKGTIASMIQQIDSILEKYKNRKQSTPEEQKVLADALDKEIKKYILKEYCKIRGAVNTNREDKKSIMKFFNPKNKFLKAMENFLDNELGTTKAIRDQMFTSYRDPNKGLDQHIDTYLDIKEVALPKAKNTTIDVSITSEEDHEDSKHLEIDVEPERSSSKSFSSSSSGPR